MKSNGSELAIKDREGQPEFMNALLSVSELSMAISRGDEVALHVTEILAAKPKEARTTTL